MFDTDGGGFIDKRELDIALVAMGFQRKMHKSGHLRKKSTTSEMIQSIAADGSVSLEEFTGLMMGEISGRDPMDNLLSVFKVLSSSEGGSGSPEVITLSKLQRACQYFEVRKLSVRF